MTTRAPQTTEPQTTEAQPQEAQATEQGGQVLRMHRAHPTLPYMTPGDLKASAQAVTSRVPAFPGRDVIFYGGLGALTVAGALEWPVALAIGGATFVLRGRKRRDTRAGAQQTATPGPTAQEESKAE
ncbi:hypothetical protein FE633_09975 [Streptomyces montanus]|uniref:Uncharacterized protein n=1 Tax=Streptomyces montanus TaxID=2580423 RepID=A0A5R9FWG8_9ACTN|nr:hypothetical protein [Streptomyces montanus]TLS46260.1 hypothetical protein FE633_09975 [Streptomyces montanus]